MAANTTEVNAAAEAVPPRDRSRGLGDTDPMLTPLAPPERAISGWMEAMDLLRARSADLRSAMIDAERAEARSRIALAAVLPRLDAAGAYTHEFARNETGATGGVDPSTGLALAPGTTVPLPDTVSASLVVSQPILDVRAWYALKTASLDREVRNLRVDDLKRRLILDAANALIAVLTAERIAELSRVGLRNALERYELALLKRRAGAITELDVQRAEQDITAARTSVIGADESARSSREGLGLILGFGQPVGIPADLDVSAIERAVGLSCQIGKDWRLRADVAALDRAAEAADRRATEASLQSLPTLGVQGALSTSRPQYGTYPENLATVRAVATWSIWDGGVRYGQARLARADADQARTERARLERELSVSVVRVQRQVAVAAQNLKVAQDARNAAANIDQMTQRTFRSGLATSLELVVAAAALRQAEITLALRQFELTKMQLAATLHVATCAL